MLFYSFYLFSLFRLLSLFLPVCLSESIFLSFYLSISISLSLSLSMYIWSSSVKKYHELNNITIVATLNYDIFLLQMWSLTIHFVHQLHPLLDVRNSTNSAVMALGMPDPQSVTVRPISSGDVDPKSWWKWLARYKFHMQNCTHNIPRKPRMWVL